MKIIKLFPLMLCIMLTMCLISQILYDTDEIQIVNHGYPSDSYTPVLTGDIHYPGFVKIDGQHFRNSCLQTGKYSDTRSSFMLLKIVNTLGLEVSQLISENLSAGSNQVSLGCLSPSRGNLFLSITNKFGFADKKINC